MMEHEEIDHGPYMGRSIPVVKDMRPRAVARRCLKKSTWWSFAAIGFWLGETLFFIARDGWHWSAASPEERLADGIAQLAFGICAYYWIRGIGTAASEYLRDGENQ